MLAAIKKRATLVNICLFLCIAFALNMGTAYADNTVRSKDIVNGQVKTADLGDNAVTTGKIKDGEVSAADLGLNSVGSDEIATDAVNATEIADNSIDGGEIVNDSLGQSDIAPGGVGASEVADSSLTGADIASSSLTGADIASNSITTADLAGTDASGSISLGTGAVANGRCNFYTISVPGAIADQTVMISARASLPAGQILYGVEVPSDDNVVMAACNFSGGTWTALSSFPIRTVTFG